MMLPLCSLILSPDLACMWSLLWKACAALGWVAASRSWHLRLLNKIAKWLLYNRGHRCIRAGHGDGGNICSCCGKCRRIRTKRKKKRHRMLERGLHKWAPVSSRRFIITYLACSSSTGSPQRCLKCYRWYFVCCMRKILLPAASSLLPTRDQPCL